MEDKKETVKAKKLMAKERALFRLNLLAGFREVPTVSIKEIPKERTLFEGSKNDYWYRLETPDNVDATVCIYELDKGQIFDPHYHENNDEQCIILTKGGELEVVTEKEEYSINFPNACFFPKKLKHCVINKSDFKIELMVVWKPRMLGWNAEFTNK